MTVREILQPLAPKHRSDAIWLLSVLLSCSQSEVLLEMHRELSPRERRRWGAWWRRRKKGEPLQYICGSAPFYGREFLVNRHTLIPRPETERLLELALELLKNETGARVLDIGAGTGCIATTLKLERPDLTVKGSDVSVAALKVARENAQRLQADVAFEKHDLFSAELRAESWRLVVSNPPYLEFNKDHIAPDVKKWEPRKALEPETKLRVEGVKDRASWCAERILRACSQTPPLHTVLELSPRVAASLERRWAKHPGVERAWREADLAGRKRFLLVAWKAHG